jgi:hypothetical protein
MVQRHHVLGQRSEDSYQDDDSWPSVVFVEWQGAADVDQWQGWRLAGCEDAVVR